MEVYGFDYGAELMKMYGNLLKSKCEVIYDKKCNF